jgi:hypothetical protein
MSYDPEFITRMLVGNLGYVLLVVSMMMTSMLLLRIFAIASGIVGGAYMGLWLGDPVGTVGNARLPWPLCSRLRWACIAIGRPR